jgi:hypothetical protein
MLQKDYTAVSAHLQGPGMRWPLPAAMLGAPQANLRAHRLLAARRIALAGV